MPSINKNIKTFLIVSLLLIATSHAHAIAMFTALGSETKDTFHITFEISDKSGTALISNSWNSASQNYQDENASVVSWLKMQYWNITFNFDAATLNLHVEAFHKIDPHTSAPDVGDTFIWDVIRPAATRVLTSGASVGSANKDDYKDHADSLGKHSNAYSAFVAYTINRYDFDLKEDRDTIAFEVTGNHRSKPVPDAVSTLGLLILPITILAAIRRKRSIA